jgi:hypothetical protein
MYYKESTYHHNNHSTVHSTFAAQNVRRTQRVCKPYKRIDCKHPKKRKKKKSSKSGKLHVPEVNQSCENAIVTLEQLSSNQLLQMFELEQQSQVSKLNLGH